MYESETRFIRKNIDENVEVYDWNRESRRSGQKKRARADVVNVSEKIEEAELIYSVVRTIVERERQWHYVVLT